jgi:tripartite-type tricarboxylate transporter receptor subunit TctC
MSWKLTLAWIEWRARSKRAVLVFAIAVPGMVPAEFALAATYPERPITVIVPFAAGGALDVSTRILAKSLSQALGQQMVVDNRGGAGGIIGIGAAARARPDGYTLLSTSSAYVLNPSMYKKIPYDPYKDFLPIVEIGVSPNVIVTRPDSGINSVADLIALAKANPDLISYGSPGVGTTPQLAAEVLKIRAKINMVHVPYSGQAPALQAVLSKQIQIMSTILSSVMGQINGGLLRPIVQTGKERWADLPNVPTMAEAGIPDAVSETFQALLAPAGTPPEIINRLAKESIASLNQREIRDLLWQAGLRVTAGGPDVLRARIVEEVPMWKDIIEKAGIKPE